MDKQVLTVKDVMQYMGVGRYTATRIIQQSGLAINKRKGQKLLIEKQALIDYLKGEYD